MGFYPFYKVATLEALVLITTRDKDRVHLAFGHQSYRDMAALRGAVLDSRKRRAIRGQG